MGSRELFIDEAHKALGIFLVSFLCMLPTPLCGIFKLPIRAKIIEECQWLSGGNTDTTEAGEGISAGIGGA